MSENLRFTKEVCEKLGYYVYRLIDPRNGQTFYVGKGKNNRVFAHVKCELKKYEGENYLSKDDDDISTKIERIKDIKAEGLDVIHIIHRHGLTEEEAFAVEAALIDCFPGLTNSQNGHASDYGVNNAKTLQIKYSTETYNEPDNLNYMIIKTREETREERGGSWYNAVRSAWKVDKKRADNIEYVLGVVDGIVKEVFKVDEWKEAGNGRYEFDGKVAPENIRKIFKDKRIPEKYSKKGNASPVQYRD